MPKINKLTATENHSLTNFEEFQEKFLGGQERWVKIMDLKGDLAGKYNESIENNVFFYLFL